VCGALALIGTPTIDFAARDGQAPAIIDCVFPYIAIGALCVANVLLMCCKMECVFPCIVIGLSSSLSPSLPLSLPLSLSVPSPRLL
jgi:hypothetical protein